MPAIPEPPISHRIHELVQRYLDRAFQDQIERPQIVDDIAVDGDWWTVPVFSPLERSDRFNYYGQLADVERAIREDEGLDVELIPASPHAV